MHAVAERFVNAVRARVRRLPLVRSHQRRARQRAIARRPALPHCHPANQAVLDALRDHGIWIGRLEASNGLLPSVDLAAAVRALAGVAEIADPASATIGLTHDDRDCAPIYLAGGDSPFAAVAAQYFALPPLYLGVDVKRERVRPFAGHTRQWHRDIEDGQVLKVLCYASDVTDGGGPLEYLPHAISEQVSRDVGGRPDYISDREMATLIPSGLSRECTGPAGTVIIFDGARLFHRAQPPRSHDRDSVTFTFVSCVPWHIHGQQRPTRKLRALVARTAPALRPLLPGRLQLRWPM